MCSPYTHGQCHSGSLNECSIPPSPHIFIIYLHSPWVTLTQRKGPGMFVEPFRVQIVRFRNNQGWSRFHLILGNIQSGPPFLPPSPPPPFSSPYPPPPPSSLSSPLSSPFLLPLPPPPSLLGSPLLYLCIDFLVQIAIIYSLCGPSMFCCDFRCLTATVWFSTGSSCPSRRALSGFSPKPGTSRLL